MTLIEKKKMYLNAIIHGQIFCFVIMAFNIANILLLLIGRLGGELDSEIYHNLLVILTLFTISLGLPLNLLNYFNSSLSKQIKQLDKPTVVNES